MKRVKRKQVAAMLLMLALVVTRIPAYEVKADSSEFVVEGNTLMAYEGSESNVTIPKNITTIAREAFENNGSLVSITIPESVEVIESGAFAGCRNLSSVTIPASVTYIAPAAFAGCDRLRNVSIAKGNEEYICENGTIYSADKSKIIQVLAGNTGIVYTIPNYVSDIERYAFWGCDNIEKLVVGTGMKKIPAYAFSNMSELETVSFADTVTEIEMKAFENCVSLGNIYISPSVTNIHESAFDGCFRLQISSEPGTVAYKFYENFVAANVTLAESEDGEADLFYTEGQTAVDGQNASSVSDNSTGKDYSFANVDNEYRIIYSEMPESADVLGKARIVGGKAVIFVNNSETNVYEGETDVTEEPVVDSSAQVIANKKYVIVNNDTIADRAFYEEGALTSYQIGSNIRRIGDFSFARSGLESVTIPEGVKSIGYGAFYNCSDLSRIYVPTSVTEIEPSAFRNTLWMHNWYQSGDLSDFLVVGDGILIAYKGFSANVTIPDSIKTIGPEVFMNHSEIETVTIPESVKVVSEDAFNGCTNLVNVAGGLGIEHIKDRAFYGCSIQTIRIPETVKSVGLLAFGNSQGTDSVIFLGNELPKVSYEKTATRFSNDAYRKAPFDGIRAAVITDATSKLEETVLDDGALGFEGVVCTIMKEPTLAQKGEVNVLKVQGEQEGSTQVPASVWIYDKEYYVANVETDAIKKQDTDVLEDDKQDALKVTVNKEAFKEATGIFADLSKDAGSYELVISESEDNRLEQIVNSNGVETDDFSFIDFELHLYDKESRVPITKLGVEKVTICLPIAKVYEEEPVVAVCLDDNGQPEYISCTHRTIGEEAYVLFETNHFSPYALLCGESVPAEYKMAWDEKVMAKKAAQYSMEYGKKDESPDTGDYIHPKWILTAGLVLLAGYLALNKSDKKKKIK